MLVSFTFVRCELVLDEPKHMLDSVQVHLGENDESFIVVLHAVHINLEFRGVQVNQRRVRFVVRLDAGGKPPFAFGWEDAEELDERVERSVLLERDVDPFGLDGLAVRGQFMEKGSVVVRVAVQPVRHALVVILAHKQQPHHVITTHVVDAFRKMVAVVLGTVLVKRLVQGRCVLIQQHVRVPTKFRVLVFNHGKFLLCQRIQHALEPVCVDGVTGSRTGDEHAFLEQGRVNGQYYIDTLVLYFKGGGVRQKVVTEKKQQKHKIVHDLLLLVWAHMVRVHHGHDLTFEHVDINQEMGAFDVGVNVLAKNEHVLTVNSDAKHDKVGIGGVNAHPFLDHGFNVPNQLMLPFTNDFLVKDGDAVRPWIGKVLADMLRQGG